MSEPFWRGYVRVWAFGFVVVKFTLFIKQIGLILGRDVVIHQHGYSAFIGVLLVAAGALTTLLSYVRYTRVKRQIDDNSFKSSSILTIVLTLLMLLISISLVAYLIQST